MPKDNDSASISSSKPDAKCSKRRQGIFWILTVPAHCFTPFLPQPCRWIRGQLELGEGGFLHWQIVVAFKRKVSMAGVRDTFGPYHCELSRSVAANEYVFKLDTRVPNTQFELGIKPVDRADPDDWERIWELAKNNDLQSIPATIRVQSYRTIRAIASDFAEPVGIVRTVVVYWGRTGTGKSRKAWDAAGLEAFPKDPRSKFWCGYRGQNNIVIDEFRGGIDIGHLLRWTDRYPVNVEIKGASTPLLAENIWITSNLAVEQWYPGLDEDTLAALRRRFKEVVHFI